MRAFPCGPAFITPALALEQAGSFLIEMRESFDRYGEYLIRCRY